MHARSMAAMANELVKIAMFSKEAESPPLFSGGAVPTPAAAKPVKDVSRGMLSMGDNIKAGPTPKGAFSFSGRKAPPLPAAALIRKVAAREKDSGFLGDMASKVKNVAMTDVGGPKGLLQSAGQAMANGAAKGGPSASFLKFQAQNRAAGR